MTDMASWIALASVAAIALVAVSAIVSSRMSPRWWTAIMAQCEESEKFQRSLIRDFSRLHLAKEHPEIAQAISQPRAPEAVTDHGAAVNGAAEAEQRAATELAIAHQKKAKLDRLLNEAKTRRELVGPGSFGEDEAP